MVIKQTDLQILTDKPLDRTWLKQRILHYRADIEGYIIKDRRLLDSLRPIAVDLKAPAIIKSMAGAAKKANVGPMAAVAGAIAQYIGSDILKEGISEVIVENGGDIFLKTKKTRWIGLYAGRSKFSQRLSLEINPADTPLGICTSSASVGHSLSFGKTDAAVVLAKDAILADALATAVGNIVDSQNDFKKAVNFAKEVKEVLGIVIILGDDLVSWGKIKFKNAYIG
jgi:ApbE superfamily uncharacterized protein (UPF0280 family)